MHTITRIIINWQEKSISLETTLGGWHYQHRHFESLYDCLCLALSMGYLVDRRTREAIELVWDNRAIYQRLSMALVKEKI